MSVEESVADSGGYSFGAASEVASVEYEDDFNGRRPARKKNGRASSSSVEDEIDYEDDFADEEAARVVAPEEEQEEEEVDDYDDDFDDDKAAVETAPPAPRQQQEEEDDYDDGFDDDDKAVETPTPRQQQAPDDDDDYADEDFSAEDKQHEEKQQEQENEGEEEEEEQGEEQEQEDCSLPEAVLRAVHDSPQTQQNRFLAEAVLALNQERDEEQEEEAASTARSSTVKNNYGDEEQLVKNDYEEEEELQPYVDEEQLEEQLSVSSREIAEIARQLAREQDEEQRLSREHQDGEERRTREQERLTRERRLARDHEDEERRARDQEDEARLRREEDEDEGRLSREQERRAREQEEERRGSRNSQGKRRASEQHEERIAREQEGRRAREQEEEKEERRARDQEERAREEARRCQRDDARKHPRHRKPVVREGGRQQLREQEEEVGRQLKEQEDVKVGYLTDRVQELEKRLVEREHEERRPRSNHRRRPQEQEDGYLTRRVQELEKRLGSSEADRARLIKQARRPPARNAWGKQPSFGSALRHVRAVAASMIVTKEQENGRTMVTKGPSDRLIDEAAGLEPPKKKKKKKKKFKPGDYVYDLAGRKVLKADYLSRQERNRGLRLLVDNAPPALRKNSEVDEDVVQRKPPPKYPTSSLERAAREYVASCEGWKETEKYSRYIATLYKGTFRAAQELEPQPTAADKSAIAAKKQQTRSWPEYDRLNLWDAIVTIEARPNSRGRQLSTRHDPQRYETAALTTETDLADFAGSFGVRWTSLTRIVEEEAWDAKKTEKPGIGAFEVQLAIGTPRGPRVFLLHSKIRCGAWPCAAVLQRRVKRAMEAVEAPGVQEAGHNPPDDSEFAWRFDQRPTLPSSPNKTLLLIHEALPQCKAGVMVNPIVIPRKEVERAVNNAEEQEEEESPRLDFERAIADAEARALLTAREEAEAAPAPPSPAATEEEQGQQEEEEEEEHEERQEEEKRQEDEERQEGGEERQEEEDGDDYAADFDEQPAQQEEQQGQEEEEEEGDYAADFDEQPAQREEQEEEQQEPYQEEEPQQEEEDYAADAGFVEEDTEEAPAAVEAEYEGPTGASSRPQSASRSSRRRKKEHKKKEEEEADFETAVAGVQKALSRSLELEKMVMESAEPLSHSGVERLVKVKGEVVEAIMACVDLRGSGSVEPEAILAFARDDAAFKKYELWTALRNVVHGSKYSLESLESQLFAKYDPEAKGELKTAKFHRAVEKLQSRSTARLESDYNIAGVFPGGSKKTVDYVGFCSWLSPVRSLSKLLNRAAKKVHALARQRKKEGESNEDLFVRLCQEHGSDDHLNQSQLAAMLLKELELEVTPAEARALRCYYAPLRPVDVFDRDSWANLINDGRANKGNK